MSSVVTLLPPAVLVLSMSAFLLPPRRHRRPLLLPRGLVALGFLLLLGCCVLVQAPRLKRYSLLQLTMPVVCDKADRLGTNAALCMPSEQELQRRLWQVGSFSGQARADSLSWLRIQRRLDGLHQHPAANSGVAIQFLAHARYANLVQVLDYLNVIDINRYFLHIHSPVTTLYVFPNRNSPSPADSEEFQPATTELASASALDRWLGQIGGGGPLLAKRVAGRVIGGAGVAAAGRPEGVE